MNIISLNTWGGLAGRELLVSFFEKYKDSVDVFCLQEIWAESYEDVLKSGVTIGGRNLEHNKIMVDGLGLISSILKNHIPFFRPHFGDHYGLLTFVKKDLKVVAEGELFVYGEKGYIPEGDPGKHSRNIQFVHIETDSGLKTVINFHGLWNGNGKGDSEDRLKQSDKIVEFLKSIKNPIVFCGDFNLLPDTQSIKKFENLGMRNLIKEFKVTSTRTSFYDKDIPYADYTFISNNVDLREFKMLPEEVSDHKAMFINIA